jgi:hypothetical protein
MPIAAVEIELSLQAYGKQTKDGKRLLYTFSLSYQAHYLLSDRHL